MEQRNEDIDAVSAAEEALQTRAREERQRVGLTWDRAAGHWAQDERPMFAALEEGATPERHDSTGKGTRIEPERGLPMAGAVLVAGSHSQVR